MRTRNETVEMLTAACSKSRLYGRFDIRAVVEEFADQLVLINDERCRQVAVMQAEFDANIAALRRELDSAKFDFLKKSVGVVSGEGRRRMGG